MCKFKICSALLLVALISGCASNQYSVTIDSSPKGAEVFCNGQSYGYAPVTRYFELDEATKKSGYLSTCHWGLKWVSGATASVNNVYNLKEFPNGVVWTTPRPDVGGYSQDAEFALKVEQMKIQKQQLDAQSININPNPAKQCRKLGDLSGQIYQFQGYCPFGYY